VERVRSRQAQNGEENGVCVRAARRILAWPGRAVGKKELMRAPCRDFSAHTAHVDRNGAGEAALRRREERVVVLSVTLQRTSWLFRPVNFKIT
jgi:hypothetical protein